MNLLKYENSIKPITEDDEKLLKQYLEEKIYSKRFMDETQRLYIIKYLKYQNWREKLFELEEKLSIPANNVNYKRMFPLGFIASILITTFSVPAIDNSYPYDSNFKGITQEQSYLDRVAYYWECRFEEWFGDSE